MIHPFIPHTSEDRKEMLSAVGAVSVDDLYRDVPVQARQKKDFLPPGISEWEVSRRIEALAGKNGSSRLVCFRGGGVYDHYVPALVDSVISRSEFYTAYTPYQPEISQGTLQYIFEYQSMVAELTGMDTVNASLYDGATAAAEAMIMAMHAARRPKVLVSETVNPGVRRVLATYARFHGVVLETVPMKEGVTDREALDGLCGKETAALIVQSPNYFGLIEDTSILSERVHGEKGLFVQIADPLSLALLKTPGEVEADIAVGEAQPLGLSLNYGGPYLGYIGTTKKFMRKLPGRICGQTVDRDGKRAFVLTLQAREQHIRREKATSNICSNQSLCSLSAAVYMATMGKEGLKEAAEQSLRKAFYVLKELEKTGKWEAVYPGSFFREFLVRPKGGDESALINMDRKLEEAGLLGGMAPEGFDPATRLISVTEKRSREEMDLLVKIMGEAL